MQHTQPQHAYDVFIIGGGINGAGVAADAALRGLSVGLAEQGDLAGATSSASSKLIHGGLRYLEYYQFNLVRKALKEREVLLHIVPHLITPLAFVMPHAPQLRSAFLIRCGLFLYDHLAKRRVLPGSKSLNFAHQAMDDSLLPNIQRGFLYYDCWVDDARLVISNALQAQQHGAKILPRHRVVKAERRGKYWQIRLHDINNACDMQVYSKSLINAAGPWVSEVNRQVLDQSATLNVLLSKGSHIVVPKLYDGEHAYILQQTDGRIVFVLPYENDFTCIGTTDAVYQGDPAKLSCSEAEKQYLCQALKPYFKHVPTLDDIVWSWSGVRALLNTEAGDAVSASRDCEIICTSDDQQQTPLVTIIGGKITSYRYVAAQVIDKLSPFFKALPPSSTANTPLPGGEFAPTPLAEFLSHMQQRYPWLPANLCQRLGKAYGQRIALILNNATSLSDLGQDFGAGLYQAEVDYLITHEWAQTSEDILYRRSKLGLHCPPQTQQNLQAYLALHFL